MTHPLRPVGIAAAVAVIGGALIVAVPQHAASIVRIGVATMAAATALYALALSAPPRWWQSPFGQRRGGRRRARTADEVDWIGAQLAAGRQRIPHGPPLPPGTIALLQPLIRSTLDRQGIDADTPDGLAAAQTLLSPLGWTVLATAPLQRPLWFRLLPPNPRQTARAVHRVLDDLDRLAADARPHPDPRTGPS